MTRFEVHIFEFVANHYKLTHFQSNSPFKEKKKRLNRLERLCLVNNHIS
jgi:hypothetical protein